MNPIRIAHDRQLFWDDHLVNTSRTSASLRQNQPRREEITFEFDAPWEGDGCNYFNFVEADGVYRMYYLAWRMLDPDATEHTLNGIRVCFLESRDGRRWERPNLGLVEFQGSRDNNILLDEHHAHIDNFAVFIDPNPDCLPEERFKATSCAVQKDSPWGLWCYTSPDGIHWKRARLISDKAYFDTLNVALWNPETKLYSIYCRGFHDYPGEETVDEGIRDIRLMTSPDFINWTDPVLVDFGDTEDYPLYTNKVSLYPRAKGMFIGFPTRYVERKEWTDNFEQLTGLEQRRKRSNIHPRYGLATTDCVLMTSRDGFHWKRQDEAWLTPGIERDYNWVYGDCYPTPGVLFTPSDLAGAPDEMSVYCHERHWSQKPTYMCRYTIRQDGFLSYHAGRAEKKLVTKPLLYEGGELSINFSTSAIGYVYVTLRSRGVELHSCELFGDTLERRVRFDGDLTELIGKEITLEFRMSDADIYSMIFAH